MGAKLTLPLRPQAAHPQALLLLLPEIDDDRVRDVVVQTARRRPKNPECIGEAQKWTEQRNESHRSRNQLPDEDDPQRTGARAVRPYDPEVEEPLGNALSMPVQEVGLDGEQKRE